jgi:hypothetical protein
MKLLSISIITYNRYHFLKKNLDLLISQIKKYNLEKDVEIFIGDDNSTDGTSDLIKKNSEKYKFIKFYINKKNLGLPENSFKMISKSKAEYLWMLSDDDFLIEGNLKKIITDLKFYSPNIYFLNYQPSVVDKKINIYPSKSLILPGLKIKNIAIFNDIRSLFNFLVEQGFYNLRLYLAQQSLFITKLSNLKENLEEIKIFFDIKKEFYPVCLSIYYQLAKNKFIVQPKVKIAIITNNRNWNYDPLTAQKKVIKYFDPMQFFILKKYFKEINVKTKIYFILSIIYSKVAYIIALISNKLKLNDLLNKIIFSKGAKNVYENKKYKRNKK